jgi:DNA polymerase-1
VICPATNAQAPDGDPRAAIPFRAVWCIDFEFKCPPGERPQPVCLVAREFFTRTEIRRWRGDLLALRQAPFDVGQDSLVVAYAAQAELACFIALGWPLPTNVLDLFAEHRCSTNGLYLQCGNSLLGALACRGLGHIDAGEKETMRRLIMDNVDWAERQKHEILEYCASDVAGLAVLLPVMAGSIDWPFALLRGRYAASVAKQQHAGIPIDMVTHPRLLRNWEPLKQRLVRDIDRDFGVYEGTTFKAARFAEWLGAHGIPWPRLPSGSLALHDDAFKHQALRYPQLQPLRELRATLGKLRLTGLAVGADGRNRFSIWPFSAKTGRNQPSTSEFVFGPSKWMRGLIRPPEGYGLAYIDFAAQEIGIAAALSGDGQMIEAYNTGDPYLAFAKMARLVPADATTGSHRTVREQCKQVMIAVTFGMGPQSLADRLGVALIDARELLRLHHLTFPRFWRWIEDIVDQAMLANEMHSVFGWQLHVGRDPNPRSLMNFPMQANGAEMLRIAAIVATEAGIEVCAPIHDAFLIAAPLHRLDEDVARMRATMTRAGSVVTGGLDIRTEAKVVRAPDRYMADGSEVMWLRIMSLLDQVEAAS